MGITPDVLVEEVDQGAFEKDLREDRYIREKDLSNHLTATIESDVEKRDRELNERKARAKRIRDMQERRKNTGKKVEEEPFKTYSPQEDYQVLQAIRYIKGFNVFESFLKSKKWLDSKPHLFLNS